MTPLRQAGATGAGAACGSRESGPEPRVGDPGAATGLPLASAPSGRMLRVCTFLGSFEPGAELADCCGAAVAGAGATGAGRTTRGAACVPRSFTAIGSSCVGPTFSPAALV